MVELNPGPSPCAYQSITNIFLSYCDALGIQVMTDVLTFTFEKLRLEFRNYCLISQLIQVVLSPIKQID